MQRNTGYFPTESLEPCGNRLFSRSALNEGYLFRGSLVCKGSQCKAANAQFVLGCFFISSAILLIYIYSGKHGSILVTCASNQSETQKIQIDWRKNDGIQPSKGRNRMAQLERERRKAIKSVPFPVSWTVKMKKKQKETQDILSYHTQAAGCSDKARAKASGGRQPIEECGRTGL